jgi:Zn ribbon nucleic-acid-binding protein
MLAHVDTEESGAAKTSREDTVPVQACPVCGFDMVAIRGSKDAVCANCGFKDSCCY